MSFKCIKCGKEYARKDFYEKHMSICGAPEPTVEKVEEKKEEIIVNQEYITQDALTIKEEEVIVKTTSEPLKVVNGTTISDASNLTLQNFNNPKTINKNVNKVEVKEPELPKCPFCGSIVNADDMYLHKLYCCKNPQNAW